MRRAARAGGYDYSRLDIRVQRHWALGVPVNILQLWRNACAVRISLSIKPATNVVAVVNCTVYPARIASRPSAIDKCVLPTPGGPAS